MNSIANNILSKRKQHDLGRRRGNGHRRELDDHELPAKSMPEVSSTRCPLKWKRTCVARRRS